MTEIHTEGEIPQWEELWSVYLLYQFAYFVQAMSYAYLWTMVNSLAGQTGKWEKQDWKIEG